MRQISIQYSRLINGWQKMASSLWECHAVPGASTVTRFWLPLKPRAINGWEGGNIEMAQCCGLMHSNSSVGEENDVVTRVEHGRSKTAHE
jgi:hypothetical protein